MSISAINTSQFIESININKSEDASSSDFMPFEELLGKAISAVGETNSTVNSDIINLALGDSDALHNITIDAAKADLAVQTLVAVRNKALDAYNEIMRITL
ncbi:Flagellar hook-basal body complex protein FliE [bioreactor metagenome]|uniref:Flagellar hook-basal body complex protein FliE n=1 Tax=bioreactor metagenome TaxID=1076179 RepID=A0A645DIW3_9ZZZZ|nr:flagellar hook-basal body complex protein FliE [Oscillospiraceae bacterium]